MMIAQTELKLGSKGYLLTHCESKNEPGLTVANYPPTRAWRITVTTVTNEATIGAAFNAYVVEPADGEDRDMSFMNAVNALFTAIRAAETNYSSPMQEHPVLITCTRISIERQYQLYGKARSEAKLQHPQPAPDADRPEDTETY